MNQPKLSITAFACLLLVAAASASAQVSGAAAAAGQGSVLQQAETVAKRVAQATALEFSGYLRSGFYSAPSGVQAGGFALGGDLQKFRLGNEGDNYFELSIGKKFDVEGTKWGVYYMPAVYNGNTSTKQIYADISGLSFAPEATFWGGQRYHRIQDIHIVDNWLMEDGDNYGAGVDGIGVGSAKLNVAIYTDGNADNKNSSSNNAKRINLQLRDLATNSGGKLSLTAAAINGDFAQGSQGGALGLLHNQEDFLIKGMNNSFFLQASNGHASLSGKFYNLDSSTTTTLAPAGGGPLFTTTTVSSQMGANQARIADAINWQLGKWGGQALVGYQTLSPDSGPKVKDISLGGRVSYGVAANVKLLGELGLTSRDVDGQSTQLLNKGTVAVAFAPNTDFWSRPEFRIYATTANWNDAAGSANAGGFGANGRSNVSTFGVQIEAWW